MMAMSKLFTSATNSVIKTQAALHSTMTRTEPQHFEIVNGKYPFNRSWYATEYIEAADAQELLSIAGNFSDGESFEADLFASENAGEEEAGWAAYKIRDKHELQEYVERIQGQLPRVIAAKTAVL